METLADAITAVDYYLQRTAEDITGGIEDILDVADASLEKLGYAGIVDERPAAQPGAAFQAETAGVEETDYRPRPTPGHGGRTSGPGRRR